MTASIELQNITKRYGSEKNFVMALESISFVLAEGEFLGVQGPSGSGKSSLLNICGLIDPPSEGRLLLGGVEAQRMNQNERCRVRRTNIGFVFQRHQLLPAMTVYENIAYPLWLNGIPRRQIQREVENVLSSIGLAHRSRQLPKQLSGGERQRVGVARALIKRPRLVIADEPNASLDHANTRNVLQLMRQLNKERGASFLIASHDPLVIESCDRKIVLEDGRRVNHS